MTLDYRAYQLARHLLIKFLVENC